MRRNTFCPLQMQIFLFIRKKTGCVVANRSGYAILVVYTVLFLKQSVGIFELLKHE